MMLPFSTTIVVVVVAAHVSSTIVVFIMTMYSNLSVNLTYLQLARTFSSSRKTFLRHNAAQSSGDTRPREKHLILKLAIVLEESERVPRW